jgi:hypothetical protein
VKSLKRSVRSVSRLKRSGRFLRVQAIYLKVKAGLRIHMANNWERCPVCNGSGSTPAHSECRVCEGSGIIHSVLGTPGPKRGSTINPQDKINFNEYIITIPEESKTADPIKVIGKASDY